ncbi:MAG TPA: hypothetical protein VMN57_03165 [Anaerolineales bacterium]|nr:hypothetical protein [Anaerolineales bacterium]
MQTVTWVVLLILIVSAPWVSRKWGGKGDLIWGMIAMIFLVIVVLLQ